MRGRRREKRESTKEINNFPHSFCMPHAWGCSMGSLGPSSILLCTILFPTLLFSLGDMENKMDC